MLLIITGGATVTPEDEIPPTPEDTELRDGKTFFRKPKPRRLLVRRPHIVVPTIEAIPPPPPQVGCLLPSTDLFSTEYGINYPLNRPMGSGRTFHPVTHPWSVAFRTRTGITLNRSTSGFGAPTYDATVDSTIRTITRAGGGTGNGLPVTCPIPNTFGNIGSGSDKLFNCYDGAGEVWHDFYRFNSTNWTAEAHYANSGRQDTQQPRGSCASGILLAITRVTAEDWVTGAICQHALGIAVQGQGTANDILGKVPVWPAFTVDSFAAINNGPVPYGAWLCIPLFSEGGPNPASLDLGVGDTMRRRMYKFLTERGLVIVDQGANIIARADQTITDALATQWVDAANYLWMHLRFIANVGASGSNPIGGGTPLAPNCGYNRTVPDIHSVQKWESRYSLAVDLQQVTVLDSRGWDDSWKHYERAYSIGGNTRMWQATKDTRYLDRALLYVNGIVDAARISSSLGPQGFNDNFLGWLGKTHPTNPVQEAALYEFYAWRWIVIMLESMEGLTGTYATQRQGIKEFMEQNVWTKWMTRGANAYVYRNVMHIAAHSAIVAMYLAVYGTTAAVRNQAITVRDNINHNGMAQYAEPNSIRERIINHQFVGNPSTTAFWRAYFSGAPASDINDGSDTSHAEAVCVFIDEAIKKGYGGWDQSDITRLLNLWTVVWPNATTHYNWLRGPTAVTSPLTWTPNYNEFFGLAGYDRNMQIRMQTFGGANQALYFGQGAYNAWRLGQS